MKAFETTFFLHIALSVFMAVSGHGRLMSPLGRSSAWRGGYNTPRNYNDNELYCGGFAHQQSLGGKCGLCGDPYDQAHPRENEAGGKYATGLIVSHYNMGSAINITVQLTANHLGYFEFRLCENNNVSKAITKQCLSQHLLTNSQTNDTKHYVDGSRGAYNFTVTVTLPVDVTCSQCVMQWKYRTGNSWGEDETGSGLGHGPQEEFYACSDIAITNGAMSNTTPSTSKIPTTSFTTGSERSSTLTSILKSSTRSTTILSSTTTKLPSTTPTPSTTTTATPTTTAPSTTTTATPTTTAPSSQTCVSVSVVTTDSWCNSSCNHEPPYCPSDFCHCT